MLRWLPIARDFRGELRAALDSASPGDCLEKLASLAAYRLGFLETVQLDRALGRLGLEEPPHFYRSGSPSLLPRLSIIYRPRSVLRACDEDF